MKHFIKKIFSLKTYSSTYYILREVQSVADVVLCNSSPRVDVRDPGHETVPLQREVV